MPGEGLEPSHPCGRQILSLLRLPFRHPGVPTSPRVYVPAGRQGKVVFGGAVMPQLPGVYDFRLSGVRRLAGCPLVGDMESGSGSASGSASNPPETDEGRRVSRKRPRARTRGKQEHAPTIGVRRRLRPRPTLGVRREDRSDDVWGRSGATTCSLRTVQTLRRPAFVALIVGYASSQCFVGLAVNETGMRPGRLPPAPHCCYTPPA